MQLALVSFLVLFFYPAPPRVKKIRWEGWKNVNPPSQKISTQKKLAPESSDRSYQAAQGETQSTDRVEVGCDDFLPLAWEVVTSIGPFVDMWWSWVLLEFDTQLQLE